MGAKEKADQHWDLLRELVNKLMKECLADAAEMVKEDHTGDLAGKLFDARWQAFVHDTDKGLFDDKGLFED